VSLTFPGQEAQTALNREALADPQPGDRWHEMYSFWLYVIWREGDEVAWCSAAAPCTFPADAKFHVGTLADWRERMTYRGDGPLADESVMWLADRGNDVSGWVPIEVLP
jgi:hypothetical protein